MIAGRYANRVALCPEGIRESQAEVFRVAMHAGGSPPPILPAGLTFDEFLAWERAQPEKHELVDGRVVPWGNAALGFAGGTASHATISANVLIALGTHLRGGPCRARGSDLLVRVRERSGRYPDISVTCDERDRDDQAQAIRYPKLIVEVLSHSTAAEDLEDKYDEYTALASLEEYLVIDSRKRWARLYRRENAGWVVHPVFTESVNLVSVSLNLSFEAIYEGTDIAAARS
jgi:Uma2 family endonuclease